MVPGLPLLSLHKSSKVSSLLYFVDRVSLCNSELEKGKAWGRGYTWYTIEKGHLEGVFDGLYLSFHAGHLEFVAHDIN